VCFCYQYKATTWTSDLHDTPRRLFYRLFLCLYRIIQENADLLMDEGQMLKDIQQKISLKNNNASDQDIDDYVEALAIILDRKEDLIGLLQDKVMEFRQQQQLLLSQTNDESIRDD
jgi:hypothetical protein